MNYIIDQNYEFPVAPPDTSQDDYFNLLVDTSKSTSVIKLGKLPFQRRDGYETPHSLLCRVKGFSDDGTPVLTHVIAPYVYELYHTKYFNNEPFECEVISVPANPSEEPFVLRDRNGIFFRLNEPDGLLVKGQIVRCKFTKLTPRYFVMARVDEGAKMPYFSPEFLFAAVGIPGALRCFVDSHIFSLPEMKSVRDEIAAKQPRWVLSACNIVLGHLSEWFQSALLGKHGALYRELLGYMREIVLFLLEGSNFLNAVSPEERRALQDRLTKIVEALQPFDRMVELVLSDRQDEFVEKLFDKLSKSGYLYHPAKQFAILMLIFRLQPDKVGYYLSRIFESIFGRDLDNWKREPFRSAFVEQFRIYVSLARREIDLYPLAENREQKTRVETIIIAMALELLLSEKGADLSRIYSLFFRYISLLRPLNSEALLSKSFLSLMGADPYMSLDYEQLKEPMMMMTKATVLPASNILSLLASRHKYSNGIIDVIISSDGISINLSGEGNITERVIPDGLMSWLKPQIYLNGIPGISGTKLRKLSEHRSWWQNIEAALFEKKTVASVTEEVDEDSRPRRRAETGDEVYIVIDSTDDFYTSNPTFNCHIEDTEYLDGKGILKRDMIVGYNLRQPSEKAYRDTDGSQFGFLATVIGIRPDGSYIFSLRDEVDRMLEDKIDFDTEYLVVITGVNDRDYSAIARAGFGLFVEKDPATPLTTGDIARCRISQKGKQGNIRAYVTALADDPDDKFDKTLAFVNIMKELRFNAGEEDVSASEEDMMRDIDEILLPDDIREIVEILRFRAIADSDLIKAYDYLRLARILASIIGDTRLADRLGAHASLLTHHQYFAKNNHIDAEKLEELRSVASGDPMLAMIFRRLELVSWLGRAEHNADLYTTLTNPSNELEGNIASMVLSYNLVQASDNTDGSIASNIRGKIMEKLNVNNETKRGKYYGSESKYLEFKTSLVYLAGAPGEELRENPAEQQFHILSRIAGMLNATGGRLYLGVNNDGYEVGMHDDFKYYERHRAVAGTYQFKISNVDNLCVFIENLINETFGSTVARKITVEADNEVEKEVILISIQESLDPVFINNRLFVRQSGQSTREYHGKDVDDFVKERAELRAERAHLLAMTMETASEPEPPETVAPENIKPAETIVEPEVSTPIIPVITTSQWRPNHLHSWENGYIQPVGYLYFIDGGKLLYSTNDLYKETGEDDCNLALAIPHDLSDGYLILGFMGEKASRIPLAEIYEKGENNPVDYYSGGELMFAALAAKDDALICVLADSGSSLWRRGIGVWQMENFHLNSTPRRIHDCVADHTVMWEIADAKAIPAVSDCLSDNLAARRIGVTVRAKQGTKDAAFKLQEIVNKCKAPGI